MTDLSAPPAPAADARPPAAGDIMVAFAGPAKQRRWTVLLRLILGFPHAVVLSLLDLAAFVVLVISWFAALFTGRVPGGLADFLTGFLRWNIRVSGYLFMLTDRYPPFGFADDDDYPIRLTAQPGGLNRLAVLFRLILIIPAAIVQALLVYGGMGVVGFVAWLIALITGRLPEPLHQAYAAVVRWQARYAGYYYLLTGVYPHALFGDKPAPPEALSAGPWAQPSGDPWAQPPAAPEMPAAAVETAVTGTETLVAGGAPEPGPALPAEDAPPAEATVAAPEAGPIPEPAPAEVWRLVLTAAAKRLVVLFLVLGALFLAGTVTVEVVVLSNTANAAVAQAQLLAAHEQLVTEVHGWEARQQACASNLGCVAKGDIRAAQIFGTFGSQLQSVSVPSYAGAALARLESATTQSQHAFQTLSTATSISQYQQDVASTNIQTALNQFDADYVNLMTVLSARGKITG